MEKESLINLGLTDGEAKVYLALISLGSSTVGPIVKESKVAYSNIYEILNRLIEKGLVSFIIKEKTKHFQAISLNKLNEYLENKEKNLIKERELLNELIPKLEKLQSKKEKQEAEIFLGLQGIKTAYERILENSENEEWLFFYVAEENYKETDNFYSRIYNKFKSIKAKGIASIEYKKSKFIKQTHFKMKFVYFPTPGNIDIYKDKTLIISWQEPLAILITSKDISNKFRDYFNSVWKVAKP